MDTLKDQTAHDQQLATELEGHEPDMVSEVPLTLSRKAEIWSGRFAMLGFMTTAMAIAFKSTF